MDRRSPEVGERVEVWAGAFAGRTDMPRNHDDPWLWCRVIATNTGGIQVQHERGSLAPIWLTHTSRNWRWEAPPRHPLMSRPEIRAMMRGPK